MDTSEERDWEQAAQELNIIRFRIYRYEASKERLSEQLKMLHEREDQLLLLIAQQFSTE